MYKILLACAGGMSTSMLVEKMQKYAKEHDIEVMIDAVSEGNAQKLVTEYDVLLLGPQVSHLLKRFQERCTPLGIGVASINNVDYALMNGEKVLGQAIALINGEESS